MKTKQIFIEDDVIIVTEHAVATRTTVEELRELSN